MQPIAPSAFEELVSQALDELPDKLWARFDNVAVVVADEHPDDPELLGLYEGVPLTERWDYTGVLPDKISVFRIPLCLAAQDTDELVDEVKVTVVHELAHHLGIEEQALRDLGWD